MRCGEWTRAVDGGPVPQGPRAYRRGLPRQVGEVEFFPRLGGVARGGEVVQRVDVGAEKVGGAGQRGGHAPAEYVLQQRQYLAPQPHPAKRWIEVVWVLPHRQAQRRARPLGGGAVHVQEWPQIASFLPSHARDRTRT